MPYRHRRDCPICGKPRLLSLSHHLSQVHGLSSGERTPWLKRAVVSRQLVRLKPHQDYQDEIVSPMELPEYRQLIPPRQCPLNMVSWWEPYPEFQFQHPFSMMVVGPTQSGKTCFVQQLLTSQRIAYPNKKPVKVYWFYNQWQPIYDEIQRLLNKKIRFVPGLPELTDDLSNIRSIHNNILVFDDLMAEAKDSPVISKLFTQGRHRNASVILLLQNLFPKGKFNTDISRNALYKVLFRSPGDRKQIDIMAEQTFAKDRPQFMKAYSRETKKPFGYIVLDNHPRTESDRQVVADVFGECKSCPCDSTLPAVDVSEEKRVSESAVKKRKSDSVGESRVKKRKSDSVDNYQVKKTPAKKRKPTIRQPPLYQAWESFPEEEEEEEEEEASEEIDHSEHGWSNTGEEDELHSEDESSDENFYNYKKKWSYPSYLNQLASRCPPTGYSFRSKY